MPKPYIRRAESLGPCRRCGQSAPLRSGLCEVCRRNKTRVRVCRNCGYRTDSLMHILGHEPGESVHRERERADTLAL